MSSRWTHAQCPTCWHKKNPARDPVAADAGARVEPCCFCGELTNAGIYVREDPAKLRCGGEHVDAELES